MNLDFSPGDFQQLLQQALDIILNWHHNHLRDSSIYQNFTPSQIQQRFDQPLPETGLPPKELLNTLAKSLIETANYNPSPNYYGYITGGGNQISIIAEILKNALNQNNLKWHSAPGNSEIEKIVIRWICSFLGYPKNAGGVLVSGGSVANFLSLAVMRKAKTHVDVSETGLYHRQPITIYVSAQGHSSIDKAIDMLGLGKQYLRKIPVNQHFQIDTDLLINQIEQDIRSDLVPACIIGIAGTTNSGAVDPLAELGLIAQKYNCWYMVDGAYGLPGAGVPELSFQFQGFEMADSLLINPHKWFYVPFEASCLIVKDKSQLKNTFSLIPDYLQAGVNESDREDLMDYNLQLTKDFKALKIYMTFKVYGADRLRKAILNDVRTAQYAQTIIDQSNDFELLAPVPLSIVCFRYLGPSNTNREAQFLDHLNEKLLSAIEEDGRIFFAGTKIKGRTALRINCTNHRRTNEDIDYLFQVLRELGTDLVNTIY